MFEEKLVAAELDSGAEDDDSGASGCLSDDEQVISELEDVSDDDAVAAGWCSDSESARQPARPNRAKIKIAVTMIPTGPLYKE